MDILTSGSWSAVHATGWALLHFLWQGALVGALYAGCRFALNGASAQARYTLGLCALAVLAAAPVATFYYLSRAAGESGSAAATALVALPTMAVQGSRAFSIEAWLPLLVALWIAGVVTMSVRALVQYARLRRLCQRAAQPMQEWDARVAVLCKRFGVSRPVRLLRSALVQTPSLIGWLSPVILLPAGVLVGLTPQQVELIIAHELGHIRRWDYIVNLLQIALQTVLFYHPVVHWISDEVRNDREACCDDLVLRMGADPVDYAKTLVSLEELRGVTHAPALAVTGGLLMARVRQIVGLPSPYRAPAFGGQGLVLVTLVVALFSAFQVHARLNPDSATVSKTPAASTPHAASVNPAPTAAGRRVEDSRAELALPPPASTAGSSERPGAAVASDSPPVPGEDRTVLLERTAFRMPLTATTQAQRPRAQLAIADLRPGRPTPIELPPSADTTDGLRILERSAPVFPHEAALRGDAGAVVLSFELDSNGVAREIRVESASMPGVFDSAAIDALRNWRFDVASIDPATRYVQTFDFALVSQGKSRGRDDCSFTLGSRICRR